MNTNTTKQKLNNGETVYGAFFRTPDTSLVELQGYLGWDFLVLTLLSVDSKSIAF